MTFDVVVADASLHNTSPGLGAAVMILSGISFIVSILTLGFGAFSFWVSLYCAKFDRLGSVVQSMVSLMTLVVKEKLSLTVHMQ